MSVCEEHKREIEKQLQSEIERGYYPEEIDLEKKDKDSLIDICIGIIMERNKDKSFKELKKMYYNYFPKDFWKGLDKKNREGLLEEIEKEEVTYKQGYSKEELRELIKKMEMVK